MANIAQDARDTKINILFSYFSTKTYIVDTH